MKWNGKLLSLLSLTAVVLLGGCASSEKKDKDVRELEERKHDKLERDYTVVDASSPQRPGWIEDAMVWARSMDKPTEKFRYFSFESSPRLSRTLACDLAKSNVRADIASEIASYINKSLAFSEEGDTTQSQGSPLFELRQYASTTLAEQTKAMVNGASIMKTYWEKRRYDEDKGASKDHQAYVCSVFVQMSTARLERAVEAAAQEVLARARTKNLKDKVEKALENVSKDFNQGSSNESE